MIHTGCFLNIGNPYTLTLPHWNCRPYTHYVTVILCKKIRKRIIREWKETLRAEEDRVFIEKTAAQLWEEIIGDIAIVGEE